jgi:DNA-binding response OmpR family regulator
MFTVKRGRGTTFKIYLPVVEGEAEAVEAKPASVLAPITRGTETILVAENESSLREYTIKLLEEQGYHVITAENGEDAIEKFRTYSNAIDLLIFDVIMPRKNGKEAYDEIRKQRPEIKALFMSGYTANIILSKGVLEAGIELITKPFTPTWLLKNVRIVLDKKWQRDGPGESR